MHDNGGLRDVVVPFSDAFYGCIPRGPRCALMRRNSFKRPSELNFVAGPFRQAASVTAGSAP